MTESGSLVCPNTILKKETARVTALHYVQHTVIGCLPCK